MTTRYSSSATGADARSLLLVLIGIAAVVLDDQAEARRKRAELTGRSTGPVTIAAFSAGICSSRPSPPSPAYTGKLVDWAKQHLNLTVKLVSRPKDASGFVVLPRRWVVEVARVDDGRAPPCPGLRTAHPILRP